MVCLKENVPPSVDSPLRLAIEGSKGQEAILPQETELFKARVSALETLKRSGSHFFPLTQKEIEKIDPQNPGFQLIEGSNAKIVRYNPTKGFCVTTVAVVAEKASERCYRELLQVADQGGVLSSQVHRLLVQGLESPRPDGHSCFLSLMDRPFFLRIRYQSQGGLPYTNVIGNDWRSGYIFVQKLFLKNISLAQAEGWKEDLSRLIDHAVTYKKAYGFTGTEKGGVLICEKKVDGVMHVALQRIAVQSFEMEDKELLGLVGDAIPSGHSERVLQCGKKVYLVTGTIQDDLFSFNASQIKLNSSRSRVLTSIVKSLWEGSRTSQKFSFSAMSELIVAANKIGQASLFVPSGNNIYRVRAEKSTEDTFGLSFETFDLTEEELSTLGSMCVQNKRYVLDKLREAYQKEKERLGQRRAKFLPSQKLEESIPLSDTCALLFSLNKGRITIGTRTFLGKGCCKTGFKVVHLSTSRKVYAETFMNDVGVDEVTNKEVLSSEGAVMQQLCHTNIVALRGFSEVGSFMSLKVEFCDQGTALRYIQKNPTTDNPKKEVCAVMSHAAQALAYIHDKNLVHMDFKPRNLFLKIEEGRIVGKVGDLNPRTEGTMGKMFTPNYSDLDSLILFCNKKPLLSHKSHDVWSLGLTFLECIYEKQTGIFVKTRAAVSKTRMSFVACFHTQLNEVLGSLDDALVGKEVNDLLRRMLTLDRETRAKLDETILGQLKALAS